MSKTLLTLCVPALLLAADSMLEPLENLQRVNQKHILAAAAQLQATDLNYRPTPEVRSVRELLGHIADTQFQICSQGRGEPNPSKTSFEKTVTTREELLAGLRESFRYCEGLTAPQSLPVLVYHSGQHYGNLVTYQRLKGIVPPSAPAGAKVDKAKPAPGNAMANYVMGFLKRGPAWTPQSTAETQKIQEGHLAHIRAMAESGKLLVAGPFLDGGDPRGILIFNTTIEEAKALAEKDPAVQSGRLALELRPWMTMKGVLPE